MEGDKVRGRKRLFSDRVGVIMLPVNWFSVFSIITRNVMYFNQGMMFTRSKTMPVPSGLLAQTGCEKGWNERAQQSKGVRAPG